MNIDGNAPARVTRHTLVAAPQDRVWQLLTDIDHWSDWHPEISSAHLAAPLAGGTTFRWKANGAPVRSRIEQIEAPGLVVWSGRSLGLRAIHLWRLEPAPDGGTRVTTEESLSGLPARVARRGAQRILEKSLDSFLAALAAEAKGTADRLARASASPGRSGTRACPSSRGRR